MEKLLASIVIVPGIVALLLFAVFTYLYQQSREAYFRSWQIGWGAYCAYYCLGALNFYTYQSPFVYFLSSLLLVTMGMCIYVSTRLMEQQTFKWRRSDVILAAALSSLAVWNLWAHFVRGVFRLDVEIRPHLRLEVGVGALLLFCAVRFYRYDQQRDALGFRLLAISLVLWSFLLGFRQFHYIFEQMFGQFGHFLGPIPQMLLGVGMLMVLFENERRAVQENALAFSTLEVETDHLLSPEQLTPILGKILDRLIKLIPATRACLLTVGRWRTLLPSTQQGFSPEFLHKLEEVGGGEYLSELANRGGGLATIRDLPLMSAPASTGAARSAKVKEILLAEGIRNLSVLSLQTRENNFGVVLFPHAVRKLTSSSQTRLLLGVGLQIGMTLENYVVMHDAHRRSKEYALLTEIGQAISSRLDKHEILRAMHKELGQLFDTSNFYIAFQRGEEIHFELEVIGGETQPRRSRKMGNGITEYIIRSGEPLLVRSDLDKVREQHGVSFVPGKPAKCYCGVPILVNGKAAGVMAAMSLEREFAYDERDLEVLRTAAGQVSVAVENARLFSEEQLRARHLDFLNTVSNTAISSEHAEQMLSGIVAEIQKNFQFDHIGIGILDYATKDIEIKAEAGTTAKALGRRIPLGVGTMGRVARTNETVLTQNTVEGQLVGILEDARSALCLPITYGDSLLGVLNIESRRENAFTPQDLLIMNTLADLLATALHNAFVFQKMQQQSITDGLTGIKTRRFFWEALSSEWKRASRSGRPFSVVLVDLDKFKEVNDTSGHLEGDLVLARVGRLLENKCRQSNVVARYGGDEFIILMPETAVEQAQILAERLRLWLATDPMLSEHKITGSFGVASFPIHGFSAESIIRVADMGMYISKKAGGDRVSTAEDFEREEGGILQRQLVSGYIEGVLQRDRTGPEHLEELVGTLRKLSVNPEDKEGIALRDSIETLARAADSRELHASGHGEAVAQYCEMIGRALNLPPEDIRELSFAGRVHDLGKMFVPERVLNQQGSLTEEEFDLLKNHPLFAGEVLATMPGAERIKKAVECHHEHLDGTGFPGELKGDDVPLWGRIIAVANSYVNLTSDRTLTPAKTSEQAITELERGSGTKYDGMLVRILARELKSERSFPNIG